ncbi:MAG: hypothetical protein ACFNXT_02835 [Actinomyces massiliensis]
MYHGNAREGMPLPPCRPAVHIVDTKRRKFLMAGFGGAVLTALTACGNASSQPPGDRLTQVSDAPQPHPASTPQNEAPDEWQTAIYEGQSFSLPKAFSGPTAHDDWGIYKVAYDFAEDGDIVQRILVTGISTEANTADGIRQLVKVMNGGLIENYSELNTISWNADDTTAIERIAFYWGPDTNSPGCTWMIASSAGVGVVTSFGAYADDVLRNSIEETLTLNGD